jgi:putative DNA primase/helicase
MQPRPNTLSVRPETIPEELRGWPQWVVWRYEWKADKRNRRTGELGDWDKPPINARTGGLASSVQRSTWSSFDEALARYLTGEYDGIGFIPTEEDPFCAGDFDGYVRDGVVDPKVQALVEAFGSYAELSPSGTGVRLLLKGRLPGGRGRNNREKRAELYDRGHYLTITGHSLNEAAIAECQPQLEQLYAQLERRLPKPDPMVGGDTGLLQRARAAKNGLKFQALFDHGTMDDYPSASEAEMALCCLLAFWTRKDPERMDRLFRQGRLMREKWDEQHGDETYGRATIRKAIEATSAVVSPGADGHERPSGLSYYGEGRGRMWQVHFPFGKVEVPNNELRKWVSVENACVGSEVARLPECRFSDQEWDTWLRDEMPRAEQLPQITDLSERGRAVAAIRDRLTRYSGDVPDQLRANGFWHDPEGRRYLVAAGVLRSNVDNQYKPWLSLNLMHSVLQDELGGRPRVRLWLPSGKPTRQEGDTSRPELVEIPEANVADGNTA